MCRRAPLATLLIMGSSLPMTDELITHRPGVPARRCGHAALGEDVSDDPGACLADLTVRTERHGAAATALGVRHSVARWRRRVPSALKTRVARTAAQQRRAGHGRCGPLDARGRGPTDQCQCGRDVLRPRRLRRTSWQARSGR